MAGSFLLSLQAARTIRQQLTLMTAARMLAPPLGL
jgi:hypothetical protein